MKIELNYYEVTFYGFLIANLFNWLDGVLTYISLYIIPKGEFYESNSFAFNMFNSVGFFNSFIYKIFLVLAITLFYILIINKGDFILKRFKTDIARLLFYNTFLISFFLAMALLIQVTLSNSIYLIFYYIK